MAEVATAATQPSAANVIAVNGNLQNLNHQSQTKATHAGRRQFLCYMCGRGAAGNWETQLCLVFFCLQRMGSVRERLKRRREDNAQTGSRKEPLAIPNAVLLPLVTSSPLLRLMRLLGQEDRVAELIVEMSRAVPLRHAQPSTTMDEDGRGEKEESTAWTHANDRVAEEHRCPLCQTTRDCIVYMKRGECVCETCGCVLPMNVYGKSFFVAPEAKALKSDTRGSKNILADVPMWLRASTQRASDEPDRTAEERRRERVVEAIEHWSAHAEIPSSRIDAAITDAMRYTNTRPVVIAAALLRQTLIMPSEASIESKMRRGERLEPAVSSRPLPPFKCPSCDQREHTMRAARMHCKLATRWS